MTVHGATPSPRRLRPRDPPLGPHPGVPTSGPALSLSPTAPGGGDPPSPAVLNSPVMDVTRGSSGSLTSVTSPSSSSSETERRDGEVADAGLLSGGRSESARLFPLAAEEAEEEEEEDLPDVFRWHLGQRHCQRASRARSSLRRRPPRDEGEGEGSRAARWRCSLPTHLASLGFFIIIIMAHVVVVVVVIVVIGVVRLVPQPPRVVLVETLPTVRAVLMGTPHTVRAVLVGTSPAIRAVLVVGTPHTVRAVLVGSSPRTNFLFRGDIWVGIEERVFALGPSRAERGRGGLGRATEAARSRKGGRNLC